MGNKQESFFDLSGEISIWVEQESSIHIKAATAYGDPVEFTLEEAISVHEGLEKAIDRLRELEEL